MTKFLLQILVVSLAFSLNSQNLNIGEHRAMDKTGGAVAIGSKVYCIRTSQNGCCNKIISVSAYNNQGQQVFNNDVTAWAQSSFGRIIGTSDKAIVFTRHRVMQCDVSSSDEYLVKMDTNGTVLFTSTLITNGTSFSPMISSFTEHPDGSFFMAAPGGKLLHRSASGQVLPDVATGLTSITAIFGLPNGNLWVNANSAGIRKNLILSPQGTMIAQQTTTFALVKLNRGTSEMYGLTANGQIERFDSNLVFMGNSTAALSAANYTVSDFTLRNDSIFVTGTHKSFGNDVHPFYAVLNANLGLIYQTVSSLEGVQPTGIALNGNNRIHIVSTCISAVYTNYSFVGHHLFPITGTFSSSADIGVENFSVVSTTATSGYYYEGTMQANVTLRNYGQDTVRNCFLNYYTYKTGFEVCYLLFHQYVQVPIPPGEAITILSNSIQIQPLYYTDLTGPFAAGKWNVCLFTTVPNGQNDNVIYNDAFCDTVLMPVGFPDLVQEKEHLRVFPNPTRQMLHLVSGVAMKRVLVYDLCGNLLRQSRPNAPLLDLDIGNLAPGVYLLRVQTDKGLFSQKLVRE